VRSDPGNLRIDHVEDDVSFATPHASKLRAPREARIRPRQSGVSDRARVPERGRVPEPRASEAHERGRPLRGRVGLRLCARAASTPLGTSRGRRDGLGGHGSGRDAREPRLRSARSRARGRMAHADYALSE
jgi:hypothetical protein